MMSGPSSLPPNPQDAAWDPFSDDLVTSVSQEQKTSGKEGSQERSKSTVANETGESGGKSSPNVETPIAVPNPERAARMEEEPGEQLVPTRKPTVIVPVVAQVLEPDRRKESEVTVPIRSASLPEERLIRPPARMPVPPPVSDDDIYAIREEPELVPEPPLVTKSANREELEPSEKRASSAKSADPWKTIFDDDEVPATWRRSSRGSGESGNDSGPIPAERHKNGEPTGVIENGSPTVSVPFSPGQRLRDAAAQRQLELLEASAQRKIQEEDERIRDASLSVWEFFRQGAVIGRIGVLSIFGIVLSGLLSLDVGDSRFMGLFRLAMAFGGGGVLLIIFLSFLLQTVLDTFELSFSRSERLTEWPVGSGFVDGILAIRYPIVSVMTASFALIAVEIVLLVFSFVLSLIPGVANGLTTAGILRGCSMAAAPLTLFFIFPLCYMTALANNDTFDVVPIAVWTVRRTIAKRLGRFYLEQLLILVALFVGGFLVGLLHAPAPGLYHVLAIGFVPPWMIFLALLWHERLGRIAAVCAEAERERIYTPSR